MKKSTISIIVVVALLLVLVFSVVGSYNGLVAKREEVETQNSKISVELQKRADLIPNFVNTVKGYSDYESKTYIDVTNARAAVNKAETASEQSEASEKLDKAISVFVNAVKENYPDLKASAQYTALLDELASTENSVAYARKTYNEKAKTYNTAIKTFPRNIIAGMFGFEKVDYFENTANAQSVPEVSFE